MTQEEYKEALERARKKNLDRAIEALIEECNQNDLTVINLEVNFSQYNMGYKIKKTNRSPFEI